MNSLMASFARDDRHDLMSKSNHPALIVIHSECEDYFGENFIDRHTGTIYNSQYVHSLMATVGIHMLAYGSL